jgi:hypothetical protein
MQLLRQVHPSLLGSYGSIDGHVAEGTDTEGYANTCLLGSLRDSQVTAHFRAMPNPSGG